MIPVKETGVVRYLQNSCANRHRLPTDLRDATAIVHIADVVEAMHEAGVCDVCHAYLIIMSMWSS
jgi:hypothetical protein